MKKYLTLPKILIGAVLLGSFTFGFFSTFLSLSLSKIFVKNSNPSPTPAPNSFTLASPKPINDIVPQKGVYNILTLGFGGAGHDGALLTDSIIVIHVDTNTHKTALISVPRDLWVTGNHKVNSAGITGFQNSKPVLQQVTGLPINYFVSVDFGGFVKIIDDLGGITVNNPSTLDDPFYPTTGQENNTCGFTEDQINAFKAKYSGYQLETQFTCRYEHLHYDKGSVNIDGTSALKFVRSRHGDSDFGRSARQFAVLQGIEAKLVSFQAAGKFDDIVNTVSKIVRTDLDVGTIKSLVQVFGDPKAYSIKQIQLTTNNVLNETKSSDGQYILVPKSGNFDFSGIRDYIKTNL
jgi:anionic cell wall polymer biosynthesis LytR-Cps2A-Psr (LCP) family protein